MISTSLKIAKTESQGFTTHYGSNNSGYFSELSSEKDEHSMSLMGGLGLDIKKVLTFLSTAISTEVCFFASQPLKDPSTAVSLGSYAFSYDS